MAIDNENTRQMCKINIAGEWFYGIGYQGLLTVNTKTYVEQPERANDGSMPNINDHETFVVPRCKVNFKLFSIEDYMRFCRAVSSANEFPVTYFDKQTATMVTHNMYCEPEEMAKIFNIGTNLIGVIDYNVSLIGTLNNLEEYNVSFYNNLSVGDSSTLSVAKHKWGNSIRIPTENDIENYASNNNLTLPSNKHLVSWNTKIDGSGFNYLPNTKANIFDNLTLYAQWE